MVLEENDLFEITIKNKEEQTMKWKNVGINAYYLETEDGYKVNLDIAANFFSFFVQNKNYEVIMDIEAVADEKGDTQINKDYGDRKFLNMISKIPGISRKMKGAAKAWIEAVEMKF